MKSLSLLVILVPEVEHLEEVVVTVKSDVSKVFLLSQFLRNALC